MALVPRLYGKTPWSEVPITSVPLFYRKTVVYWRGYTLYGKIPYKPLYGAILADGALQRGLQPVNTKQLLHS